RLTVPALRHLQLDPCGLNGFGGPAFDAFDGRDALARNGGEWQHARTGGFAFQMNRAGATLRHAAAELRAVQARVLANRPEERRSGIGVERNVLAVQDKRCRHGTSPWGKPELGAGCTRQCDRPPAVALT